MNTGNKASENKWFDKKKHMYLEMALIHVHVNGKTYYMLHDQKKTFDGKVLLTITHTYVYI